MRDNGDNEKGAARVGTGASESSPLQLQLDDSKSDEAKRETFLEWATATLRTPPSCKKKLKRHGKIIRNNIIIFTIAVFIGPLVRAILGHFQKDDISLQGKNGSEFGLTDAGSVMLFLVLLNWKATHPTPKKESIKASCMDKNVRCRIFLRNFIPTLLAIIVVFVVKYIGFMSGEGYIKYGPNGNRIFELSDVILLVGMLGLFHVTNAFFYCKWKAGFSNEANDDNTAISCCFPRAKYVLNFQEQICVQDDVLAAGNEASDTDSVEKAQDDDDLPHIEAYTVF